MIRLRNKISAAILLLFAAITLGSCRNAQTAPSGSTDLMLSENDTAQSDSESMAQNDSSDASAAPHNSNSRTQDGSSSPSRVQHDPDITDPSGSSVMPDDQSPLEQSGAQPCAPSISGRLHVENAKLCGEDGRPVQLKGISTHGLAWFPEFVNEACFAQLHSEWGMNVIRLALYTAEYGGFCNGGDQESLKKLIRDGVSYAQSQDMYAVIDWHILSDANPNQYLNEAKMFFGEMSKEFAASDHVIYEICNEPNSGTSWDEIKNYADEIIPVIRANSPDAVIITGTPNWSQNVDEAAQNPITGYDNLMYAFHFYAASHKDDMRTKLESAINAGLPVIVTEYGICDAGGNGAVDLKEADAWISFLDRYGVSYIAWNLSNKDETSAVFKSSCKKTSGFTSDDLSIFGEWLYQTITE